MQKQNKKHEKSNEQYRRDIFTLKRKIKQQQEYLQQAKQKCSEVDIFTDASYSFQMRIKILQSQTTMFWLSKKYRDILKTFTLNSINQIFVRTPYQEAAKQLELLLKWFIDLLMSTAHEIQKQAILLFFLDKFLVMNICYTGMDSILFNPLIVQLDEKETGIIELKRYNRLLKCFMIDTEPDIQIKVEKQGEKLNQGVAPLISALVPSQKNELNQSFDRICVQLQRMQILPVTLFKTQILNVATTAGSIKSKLKNLDNLDCIAVYLKCDPTKQGAIQTNKVIKIIQDRIGTLKKFEPNTLRKIRLQQVT